MKKMTLDEFKALLQSDGWSHRQKHQQEGDGVTAHEWGYFFVLSTLDDVTVTYAESYICFAHEERLIVGHGTFEVSGVEFVDCDDDDAADACGELGIAFWDVDYDFKGCSVEIC